MAQPRLDDALEIYLSGLPECERPLFLRYLQYHCLLVSSMPAAQRYEEYVRAELVLAQYDQIQRDAGRDSSPTLDDAERAEARSAESLGVVFSLDKHG